MQFWLEQGRAVPADVPAVAGGRPGDREAPPRAAGRPPAVGAVEGSQDSWGPVSFLP